MKKLILAAAVAASLVTNFARAEDEAPKPDNELTYNAAVVSDYRYRGLTQSRFDPAVQVGADYTNNPTGLYAGTWLSSINWIKDGVNMANGGGGKGPVEWDLYGGKRGDIGGGFTYDVGGLYYYYPNNNYASVSTNKNANTFELYGQAGYGPAYLKYSQSLTTLFGTSNSKYSQYYDFGVNIDAFYGTVLGLHVGHQTVRGNVNGLSYNDWKIALSKTFDDYAGITLSVAFVGTDLKDSAGLTTPAANGLKNIGKQGLVFSIAKTF